ncbi:MAG: hypothetical protein A2073_04115 [Deltaproteobacteria bacterium GWC2_42_11]|nr:MAG: hypothetical protein A2073_04115 [Deltaproteobacteria bacterium GWC2_42_11]HBO85136.1 cation transporter [Deltaproteobacteria bacterium]
MSKNIDTEKIGIFKIAIGLTAFIFFAELIAGYLTNSLALLSDSAHVFMDAFALTLSWFAVYICSFPPTETRTYGWHRMEVFAAFINGTTLLFISAFILYKAYFRIISPQHVESTGMFIVAAIGLAANLIVAFWLRDFSRDDLNVKSAYLHVVWDALASIGVIIGAVIIHYTGWFVVDPIISMGIGIIIISGALRIVKESTHILLEGVPTDIDTQKVIEDIKGVEGVTGIHNLHIWSLCSNIYAMSAHIDIEPDALEHQKEIIASINEKLAHRYHIAYTTLQTECKTCLTGSIFRTMEHSEKGHTHYPQSE